MSFKDWLFNKDVKDLEKKVWALEDQLSSVKHEAHYALKKVVELEEKLKPKPLGRPKNIHCPVVRTPLGNRGDNGL